MNLQKSGRFIAKLSRYGKRKFRRLQLGKPTDLQRTILGVFRLEGGPLHNKCVLLSNTGGTAQLCFRFGASTLRGFYQQTEVSLTDVFDDNPALFGRCVWNSV